MIAAGVFLLLFITVVEVGAFYEERDGDSFIELRGFASLGGGQLSYPDAPGIYNERDDQAWSGDLRLLAEIGRGDDLLLSANILQAGYSKAPLMPLITATMPPDVERSSLLTWEQHDSRNIRTELLADTLKLQYHQGRFDLTAGRQPINLATTFYFVPNDFFAPFSPQTFFRSYKPGVDAIRADYRLAELSQLTLLGVLAYNPDPSESNGWSREPDWSRTAVLARLSREIGDFGLTVLGGTVNDYTIAGAGVQGDFGGKIGLRAEGHYGDPEKTGGSSYFQISVGLEQQFANNSNWRVEYFYNDKGSRSRGQNQEFPPGGFLNREYAALGLGHEFTPLLNTSFLVLANLNDDSQLYSVNFLYSLSDESEFSAIFSFPAGQGPGLADYGSEFGLQPRMALFEYRLYF